MKTFAVILLFCCCAVQLAVSQTTTEAPPTGTDQCTDIGDNLQPMVLGADILECPAIRADELQCCTQDFINARLAEAEELFLEGLRDELQGRFTQARTVLMRLREYLNVTFVDNYFDQLTSFSLFSQRPGQGMRGKRDTDSIRGFEDELRDDFDDDDDEDSQDDSEDSFDETRFVDRVVDDSVSNAVALFNGEGTEVQECVRTVIEEHFDDDNEQFNADALENIRRTIEAIDRLLVLLDNFEENLAGFQPLQQCVETLVRLNTCGRCLLPRPAFCRNVCGALARACYSPFQNAFSDQLGQLWELIRTRLFDVTEDTLDKLEDADLFDTDSASLASEIRERCGVDVPTAVVEEPTGGPLRKRRQDGAETTTTDDEDESPTGTDDDSEDSESPTDTDDDSEDSESSVTDSDGIGNRLRLPGPLRAAVAQLMGRNVGLGFPRLCNRILVRSGNCWGGDERGELDQDIPVFNANDIEGQVDNPAIQIPQETLEEAARALTPEISNFISSEEFQSGLPDTLTAPGGSGAKGLALSLTALTLSLLFAAFML